MDTQAIFLLKDFARFYYGSFCGSPASRGFPQRFAKNRSTIVLSGATIQLPPEIEHNVVHYDLKLPEREELRKVF